jgi:hypothetical protein
MYHHIILAKAIWRSHRHERSHPASRKCVLTRMAHSSISVCGMHQNVWLESIGYSGDIQGPKVVMTPLRSQTPFLGILCHQMFCPEKADAFQPSPVSLAMLESEDIMGSIFNIRLHRRQGHCRLRHVYSEKQIRNSFPRLRYTFCLWQERGLASSPIMEIRCARLEDYSWCGFRPPRGLSDRLGAYLLACFLYNSQRRPSMVHTGAFYSSSAFENLYNYYVYMT